MPVVQRSSSQLNSCRFDGNPLIHTRPTKAKPRWILNSNISICTISSQVNLHTSHSVLGHWGHENVHKQGVTFEEFLGKVITPKKRAEWKWRQDKCLENLVCWLIWESSDGGAWKVFPSWILAVPDGCLSFRLGPNGDQKKGIIYPTIGGGKVVKTGRLDLRTAQKCQICYF